MSDTITCPQCKFEIEVTEVLSAQLGATIRADLEEEFAKKNSALSADRTELALLLKQLDDREAGLDERVKAAIALEREQLIAKARAEAKEAAAVEIQDREEQLGIVRAQLKALQQQELDLRKKQRELQERAEQQEIEITRRLDEEREKIRSCLEGDFAKKTQKLAAERQLLDSLQKQLEVRQTEFDEQLKRQKQLDRALASTTGMYGDLQGIIGSGLREIEGMDMLALESIDDSDEAGRVATAGP